MKKIIIALTACLTLASVSFVTYAGGNHGASTTSHEASNKGQKKKTLKHQKSKPKKSNARNQDNKEAHVHSKPHEHN